MGGDKGSDLESIDLKTERERSLFGAGVSRVARFGRGLPDWAGNLGSNLGNTGHTSPVFSVQLHLATLAAAVARLGGKSGPIWQPWVCLV